MKNGLDLIHELVQENNNEINSIRESIFDRLDNAKYHYNEYINLSNVKTIKESIISDTNININFIDNTELYISVILSLFSLWIDTSLVAERLKP